MKLSVVITVYNEEENIKPLIQQLWGSLSEIDHEVIIVNDGSTDNTLSELKEHSYDRVIILNLHKNSGQTAAMAAGIEHSRGKYIVTMDGDLQNDPADIPMLLKEIEKGKADLLAGNRKNRKDGFIFRKLPSKVANKLIRWVSGVNITDYGCSLKIFKSSIAKHLGLYGELHRFIPILAKLQGANIQQIDVNHRPRLYGTSKYGIGRTLKVVSDLVLMSFFQRYFQKPMHLFGGLGILSLLIGVGINFYLLIEKFLGYDIWGRPLLILGVLLVLAGIQLITGGFIAEMMMRTYYEAQNKKIFIVEEVFVGKKHYEAPKAYS